MADRVYTKQEVDAILARALELQGHGEATTHQDLVAVGKEIGLPPEAIERAAGEVLARRRVSDDVRALRARSWRGFYAHLLPYLTVSALLAFINLVIVGGPPWFVIVMLAWGVGLGSHLLAVASPDPERLRRKLERQRDRAERRSRHARVASGSRVRVKAADPEPEEELLDEAGDERDAERGDERQGRTR
jgi:hypothetical protein